TTRTTLTVVTIVCGGGNSTTTAINKYVRKRTAKYPRMDPRRTKRCGDGSSALSAKIEDTLRTLFGSSIRIRVRAYWPHVAMQNTLSRKNTIKNKRERWTLASPSNTSAALLEHGLCIST